MTKERARARVDFICKAPDEFFTDDAEVYYPGPGLPCDDRGVPGWWCMRCPYGDYEAMGEVDDER